MRSVRAIFLNFRGSTNERDDYDLGVVVVVL